VAIFAGRPHEADALLAGALKLTKEHGLVREQVRAQINIAANLARVDPRQSLEMSLSTVTLARKYGLRDAEGISLATALEVAILLCQWDWIEAAIAENDEDLLESSVLLLSPRAVAEALRGDLESARRNLERHRHHGDMTSTQDRAISAAAEAVIAFVDGDFDAVLAAAEREAAAGVHDQLWPFGVVGRAAVWKGDLEAAEREHDRLRASTLQNAWVANTQLTLEASITAARGDRSAALAMFKQALTGWDRLDIPLPKLFCQMDMAILIGGDEAEGARAEAEAYFSDLGNIYFVRRLQGAES
jgi:hypothetical protein